MTPLAFLAGSLTLSAMLTAQVPTDSIVVLEFFSAGPFGANVFSFVDVRGGGTTSVGLPLPFGTPPLPGVAVDPGDPQNLHFVGQAGAAFAGIQQVPIGLLATAGAVSGSAWTLPGADRIRVAGGLVYTLRAGGIIESSPVAGGAPSTVLQLGNAVDIAVAGSRLYVASRDPTNPSIAAPLVEFDLAAGTQRVVGNYSDMQRIAASPGATKVAIGTTTTLDEVDPVTGANLSTQPIVSPVVAVAYSRQGALVWAESPGFGFAVKSSLAPFPIVYSSSLGTVMDLDVSGAVTASAVPYGSGCSNGGSVTWGASGRPVLGDATFQLSLGNAPTNDLVLLFLGDSRTFSTVQQTALPLDLLAYGAGGCSLWVDPLIGIALLTDVSGSVSQSLPIPNDPLLAGVEWVAQAFVSDPLFTPYPLAATSGVAFRLNP